MQLRDIKVLIFDCYGTLINWETGTAAGLGPLTDRLVDELKRIRDRDVDDIMSNANAHRLLKQKKPLYG